MTRKQPVLIQTGSDRPVAGADFLFCLKQGMLMALNELGVLNDLQLHRALELP